MITYNEIVDAISVCNAYDPMGAPLMSEAIATAWLDHFQNYPNLDNIRVREAIRTYYTTPGRPWPQPADISAIARAKLRDESDRAPLQLTDSGPASEEHRKKCLAEIRRIISRQEVRWSVPKAQ